MQDFDTALRQVRPSVSEREIEGYLVWDREFGSHVGSFTGYHDEPDAAAADQNAQV